MWGVKTFYYNNLKSTDKTVEEINQIALEKGFVEEEDYVVNLAAMPIESKEWSIHLEFQQFKMVSLVESFCLLIEDFFFI